MLRGRSSFGVRGRLVALAAAVTALGSACGPPSADYVRDPSGTLLLKLPTQWTVFDQTQLYRNQHPETSFQTAETATAGQWTIGFDAAPQPSVGDLLAPDAQEPTGFAKVRPAQASETQTLSTYAGLRNLVFSLDQEASKTPDLVKVGSSRVLHFPGGYRALRVTFRLRDTSDGPFTTITQITAVDSNVQNVYFLVIGCREDCYRQNQSSINLILNSWTLKEK